MIANVLNIVEKQGVKGTYLNVTFNVEGKKVVLNSFDNADNMTIGQAKEKGLSLVLEIGKNDKGYDNLTSVKILSDVLDVQKPTPTPVSHVEPPPMPKTTTEKPNYAEDTRTRSMALSYAKDLCVAGKIELYAIPMTANGFYTYMTSGKL